MRACLVEDRGVRAFDPLTLTRPIFDLYVGFQSLATKQARYFGCGLTGRFVRDELADWIHRTHPHEPVNDLEWLRRGPVLIVNGRWLPPEGPPPDLDGPVAAWADEEIAWALVTPDDLDGVDPQDWDEAFANWRQNLPSRLAGGRMLRHPGDLLAENGCEIDRDLRSRGDQPSQRPIDITLIGPAGRLRIDPTARIEPMVVADTSAGPVVIDRGAKVGAFSRLDGPCYIGPGSTIHGAHIRPGSTIGPACLVGGEVEATIMQGFVAKPHNGYLGHCYVGAWVEIGPGCQTAEASIVTMHPPRHRSSPGAPPDRRPSCCLIGDHAQIGAGTLLPPGALIGVFASTQATAARAPSFLPSFATFHHGRVEHDEHGEQTIARAEDRMRQADVEPSPTQRELFLRLLDHARFPRFDIRAHRRETA